MAAAIIVIVIVQYQDKDHSPMTALKCEATKTALATLLWIAGWVRAIWWILTEGGNVKEDDEHHRRRRSALSFLWPSIWTILIM